jgi:hypothetical protein
MHASLWLAFHPGGLIVAIVDAGIMRRNNGNK